MDQALPENLKIEWVTKKRLDFRHSLGCGLVPQREGYFRGEAVSFPGQRLVGWLSSLKKKIIKLRKMRDWLVV